MKNYEKIINLILKHVNVVGSDLFKKAHLGKPSITYYEIFKNICIHGEHAVIELNINKKTFTTNMSKLFPNKPKTTLGWHQHIFHTIGLKRCCTCKDIKNIKYFGKDSGNTDKLDSTCKGCRKYYNDTHVEERKELSNRHYQKNKDKYKHKCAKRRALLLNACPSWSDQNRIKLMYTLRPKDYHVDHIIPLTHNIVCGLHHELNLQYLLAKENLSKSNAFIYSTKLLEVPIKYGDTC